MIDKGIDQKISISLYIKELEQVQNYIDNISKESTLEDNKYEQVLNYLNRRKQSLQYEIQEHAKRSQEIYKEKLEEIKILIEEEKNKLTKLEENVVMNEINSEILVQEIIEGKESSKIDFLVSKDVIEELTKVYKYLQKQIEYFKSINVIDNQKQNIEDNVTNKFSSYEEEIEIIKNVTEKFNDNANLEIGRYLNTRKYTIYYRVQNDINQKIEEYTEKFKEIKSLILSEHKKLEELEKNNTIKEKNSKNLIYEAINTDNIDVNNFIISTEVIKDLSKIGECLNQNIEFLKSINIEKDGFPNLENPFHITGKEEKLYNDDNSIKEDAPRNNQEMSIVSKQPSKLDFIKNFFKTLKEKLAKQSKEKENKTYAKKDINTKKESIRDKFGGYNTSQNEFEKNALKAIKQQEQFNNKIPTKSKYYK